MTYSLEFRDRMVQRMLAGSSASALSEEVNIPSTTLSLWRRSASARLEGGIIDEMKRKPRTRRERSSAPASEASNGTPIDRRPADWSPEEKVAVVLEAAAIGDAALGEWLRVKGLREADLTGFRNEVRDAAVAGLKARKAQSPDAKRVKDLERELKRKEAALAETAALLVLRKKAVALWGEEGDDT